MRAEPFSGSGNAPTGRLSAAQAMPTSRQHPSSQCSLPTPKLIITRSLYTQGTERNVTK